MKILYVHVGTPKTGTTAIQRFCADNREVLARKGFAYPDFPFRYAGKGKNRNGLFLASRITQSVEGYQTKEEEQARFEDGLQRVKELFQSYDNVILSDEGIWLAVRKRRATLWEELKQAGERDGYVVKLIVYLRDQGEYAISAWNQRIKHPVTSADHATETWEHFAEDYPRYVNLAYWETLSRAAEVLGKEHIIVRRYSRSALKGGMTQEDFLDVLGLTLTEEYTISKTELNERLSLNACEMKRIINGLPELTLSENEYFRNVLLSISDSSSEEYPCVLWSCADAARFMEQFEEGNRKVADAWLDDGGPLFTKKKPETGETEIVWERDNPHMMSDLVRFTVASNAALLRRVEELEKQNKALENQKKGWEKKELENQRKEIQKLQKDVAMLKEFRKKVRNPFRALFAIIKRTFS